MQHNLAPFSQVWQQTVESRSGSLFLDFEIEDGTAVSWTYAEFDVVVDQMAALLAEQGTRRGSAVHLALANSPVFVAVWLAAVKLGAWIVPADPQGSAGEFALQLKRTQPAVGICAESRASLYREAARQYCAAESSSSDPDSTELPVLEFAESARDFEQLADYPTGRAARPGDSFPPDPLDRAAVMFTSGTTGQPKGVEITQANYSFAGQVMAEACGLAPGHKQLVVLPLFHANAQYYSFASAIWAGASVALMPRFSASRFVEQARSHRATHASLFAAPMRMILARGGNEHGSNSNKGATGTLEHCWFAQNIADDQYAQLSELFGCEPRQLYGMTETIPAVLSDTLPPTPQSIGQPTPGCSVQVQTEDGAETDTDSVGEIAVGGQPGTTLFNGYLDDPQTTAASFRDGWFLTGDRAVRDAQGRCYFVGRQSEILKVAGENVSLVEVEQVLSAHPEVLEASVVGRPDAMRDEVPVGFVVANDPASPPSETALRDWCEQHLSKSKRPHDFVMLDQLPRTSVGKIRKFMLQDQAAQLS